MMRPMDDAARVDEDWPRDRPPGKSELHMPPGRLIWGGLALLLALILLGGFYIVISQAVERSHVYWAQATRVSKSGEGCDPAIRNATAGGCQAAKLELGRVAAGR